GACQTLTPNRKGFMAQHSVRLDAPHSRPRRGDLRFNRPSGLDEAATYIRARCRIEIICRQSARRCPERVGLGSESQAALRPLSRWKRARPGAWATSASGQFRTSQCRETSRSDIADFLRHEHAGGPRWIAWNAAELPPAMALIKSWGLEVD